MVQASQGRSYGYDLLDRLRSRASAAGDVVRSYSYDALARLTGYCDTRTWQEVVVLPARWRAPGAGAARSWYSPVREYLYYPGMDRPHSVRRLTDHSLFYYTSEEPGHVTGLVLLSLGTHRYGAETRPDRAPTGRAGAPAEGSSGFFLEPGPQQSAKFLTECGFPITLCRLKAQMFRLEAAPERTGSSGRSRNAYVGGMFSGPRVPAGSCDLPGESTHRSAACVPPER